MPGGAHRFLKEQINIVKESILKNYESLKNISIDDLLLNRNQKFLNITKEN